MRLLGDKVLVKPAGREGEEVRESGFVIPVTAQEKVNEGTIVNLGPEAAEAGLEKDEIIIYSKYGGVEVEVDGEELLILRVSDVLLIR